MLTENREREIGKRLGVCISGLLKEKKKEVRHSWIEWGFTRRALSRMFLDINLLTIRCVCRQQRTKIWGNIRMDYVIGSIGSEKDDQTEAHLLREPLLAVLHIK